MTESEATESEATEREPGPTGERPSQRGGAPEPDVLLDIPEVTVDQLRLAVDGLDADLSLRARLANLVQLDAGVRVHLEGVELDLTGVSAEALLKVRLEKLVQILDRALATIDRNPQVIDALARATGVTAEDVNRVAGRSPTVRASRSSTEPGSRSARWVRWPTRRCGSGSPRRRRPPAAGRRPVPGAAHRAGGAPAAGFSGGGPAHDGRRPAGAGRRRPGYGECRTAAGPRPLGRCRAGPGRRR